MLKNASYLALPLSVLIAVAWFSTYTIRYIIHICIHVRIIITLNILTDFLQSMVMYQLSNMKLTSLNVSQVDW